MPAIQPARLRQQVSLLAQNFEQPTSFVRSLRYLLDFYSERIRRHGQTGKPGPLLPAYRVPQPVLKSLVRELIPLVERNPSAALELCDVLWEEPFLEFRLLASMLLGQIPALNPEPILERIRSWMATQPEDILIDSIFESGLAKMRQVDNQAIITLAEVWLNGDQDLEKQLGLRLIKSIIQETRFTNLPLLFRLINPVCQNAPPVVRPDLLDLIEALAERSPMETAHFLRQMLNLPGATHTPWIVRQVIHAFPPELQKSLRLSLRSIETSQPVT